MKVGKLLHTRYRLNDLERTVKFYKEILGLDEVRRHKSPRGSELVFMQAPGSEELIELCYFPSSGPVQVQPDLTHLAFEVESLDEFGKAPRQAWAEIFRWSHDERRRRRYCVHRRTRGL